MQALMDAVSQLGVGYGGLALRQGACRGQLCCTRKENYCSTVVTHVAKDTETTATAPSGDTGNTDADRLADQGTRLESENTWCDGRLAF